MADAGRHPTEVGPTGFLGHSGADEWVELAHNLGVGFRIIHS